MSGILEYASKLQNQLMFNFLGGPKIIQLRWVINTFKGLTVSYILLLMYYFQNFSLGAYLYLALHGSYGMLWIVKDLAFGDKSWQIFITIPSALLGSAFLCLYWTIGFVQISGQGISNPTMGRVMTALMMYILGVTLMLVSDAQKYFTLKYKKGLITEGMFYYTRNPNYLGEMLLYGSFAVLTGHYYCYSLLIFVWSTLFNVNMYLKDKSFSKKAGWEEYKKHSWILMPKIFSSDKLTVAAYGILGGFLCYDYSVGGAINLLKQS